MFCVANEGFSKHSHTNDTNVRDKIKWNRAEWMPPFWSPATKVTVKMWRHNLWSDVCIGKGLRFNFDFHLFLNPLHNTITHIHTNKQIDGFIGLPFFICKLFRLSVRFGSINMVMALLLYTIDNIMTVWNSAYPKKNYTYDRCCNIILANMFSLLVRLCHWIVCVISLLNWFFSLHTVFWLVSVRVCWKCLSVWT